MKTFSMPACTEAAFNCTNRVLEHASHEIFPMYVGLGPIDTLLFKSISNGHLGSEHAWDTVVDNRIILCERA